MRRFPITLLTAACLLPASGWTQGVPVMDSTALVRLLEQITTLKEHTEELAGIGDNTSDIRALIGSTEGTQTFTARRAGDYIRGTDELIDPSDLINSKNRRDLIGPLPAAERLTADQRADAETVRDWAVRNLFLNALELENLEERQVRSHAMTLWRTTALQVQTIDAWAHAVAAHQQLERHEAAQDQLAEMLSASRSLRSDIIALASSVAETNRMLAMQNALTAMQLETQALMALQGARQILEPDQYNAVQGIIQ